MCQRENELSSALWKLVLFLTMIPLGIVSALVVLVNPYYVESWYHDRSSNVLLVSFVLLCIALFSNIGLIWTITILVKQTRLERQQILEVASRSYYETMEVQQFEIRRLKHDMTNHLQTIHGFSEEQREQYIEELIQSPVFTQTLQYCGDDTINAVISAKKERMRQHQIECSVKAEVVKEVPFEKADICAILANVLDNAIEACCKLEQKDRQIKLDIKMQKGLFIMKAKNSVPEEGIKEGFKSTKKHAKEHGYGLRSIREVAERYGGKLEIVVEEQQCKVLLYLPVKW